jgi:hypothetical protein
VTASGAMFHVKHSDYPSSIHSMFHVKHDGQTVREDDSVIGFLTRHGAR